MDENFSEETKALIVESRSVAIDLGYDYISTIHFFLADCKLNNRYTIRNFVFKTISDFQVFYNSQKIGEPTIFSESLPLTLEAEKTIKRAYDLWNKKNYKGYHIYPYHLFLASSQLKETLFYSILEPKDKLNERLESYYLKIGQLTAEDIRKSIWSKFQKK